MDECFKVVGFVNAQTGKKTYRVLDLRNKENPINIQAYGEKAAAEAALALAIKNQLNLGESWNRSLLRLNGSLSTDSEGKEIFVGLSRDESETYVELHDGEPTDEFIALDHRHREARTGISDMEN